MTFDKTKLEAGFTAADEALRAAHVPVSEAQGVLNAAVSAYEDILLAQIATLRELLPADDADEYDDAVENLEDWVRDNAPAGMEWDGDIEDPSFWEPSTC